MHIPRSAFIKVWNCLSNVLCISIFSWSDLCVWNKIEPPCHDLRQLQPFWSLIFPPPSSHIGQAHKLPMMNSHIYLLVQVCYCWTPGVTEMPPYRWHTKHVRAKLVEQGRCSMKIVCVEMRDSQGYEDTLKNFGVLFVLYSIVYIFSSSSASIHTQSHGFRLWEESEIQELENLPICWIWLSENILHLSQQTRVSWSWSS